jgi:hypothetical protein
LREPRGVRLDDVLLIKKRAIDDWKDIDMIRKCSLIMYENSYCEMRLRGMKTKEKQRKNLKGTSRETKGACFGETGTRTSFGGNEGLVCIRIKMNCAKYDRLIPCTSKVIQDRNNNNGGLNVRRGK